MKNYRVNFYKIERKEDPKTGEVLEKTYNHTGSITLDDSNVDGTNLTLASKAYRHASANQLACDRLEIFEIK